MQHISKNGIVEKIKSGILTVCISLEAFIYNEYQINPHSSSPKKNFSLSHPLETCFFKVWEIVYNGFPQIKSIKKLTGFCKIICSRNISEVLPNFTMT